MKISFNEIIILIIAIMIKSLRIICYGLLADVHVRGWRSESHSLQVTGGGRVSLFLRKRKQCLKKLIDGTELTLPIFSIFICVTIRF